ncbi:type II toxin-antitoxin system RelE/ParE family toxin [Endozoicomonas sp.]|uniref:type II toxin-antitoxin system RelE/ParE family toxin n=1 Tax=Endozoicomonas sp. TaxID=1892382 RepID=UPI00383ADBDF
MKSVNKMQTGNFGDHKSVGEGVMEYRIDYGPGYRLYYALDGDELIILFCGGDKSSQPADIRQAKGFWNDYHQRRKNGY